jgi:hypothetical protein
MAAHMRQLAGIPILALLLSTFACADGPEQLAPKALAKDSSGVTIIEVSRTELQGPVLRIVPTPSLRIGVAEGPEQYELYQVRGVRQLADSSILVLNAGTHEVRRYDASGRWMGSSGRRGGGPGEMQFPMLITSGPAATSWIFDLTRRAFHVIDADGRIVDYRPTPTSLSGFVGLLDSTTAVVADPYIPRNIYNSVLTAEVTLATVDLGQAKTDTLLRLPGFQEYRYTHGELVRAVRVPFTSMPAVGVRYGHIYVADGRSPEVRVYDRDGQLLRIVRLQLAAVAIDEAEWERTVRFAMGARAGAARGEARLAPPEVARQSALFAEMQRPAIRPFFDRVYLEHGGTIWLRRYSSGDEEQHWIGLSKEGEVRGVVTVPPQILVREITEGWVLGQEVDELEAEYVVRYPLQRSH